MSNSAPIHNNQNNNPQNPNDSHHFQHPQYVMPSNNPQPHSLQSSKLQSAHKLKPLSLGNFIEGLTQLAALGVIETTDLVEAMHREIMLRPIGRFNDKYIDKWQGGITGRIYNAIRGVTNGVGHGMAAPIVRYNKFIKPKKRTPLPTSLKLLVNIINGVMGDYLVTHENALAIPIMFYDRYGLAQTVQPVRPILGRVVILAHGLCMSYLCWRVCEADGLGERIIDAQPKTTVLYLDYNTGQHISNNGQDLSILLQDLVDNNPDISQIDLVAHSMGGLVVRSALFYGTQSNASWVNQVGKLITLGTPHNGAILERIGHFVQEIMVKIPFAGALSRLGNIRSKGINDLRYANISEEQRQTIADNDLPPNPSYGATLIPKHIYTYCIAGTMIEGAHDSSISHLIGDGLVMIESALAEHGGEKTLNVPESHKAIFYEVSHYNLLFNTKVHSLVVTWLSSHQDDFDRLQDPHATRQHIYPEDLTMDI